MDTSKSQRAAQNSTPVEEIDVAELIGPSVVRSEDVGEEECFTF
ncbi:hypothetical protein [Streptomyces syringium]